MSVESIEWATKSWGNILGTFFSSHLRCSVYTFTPEHRLKQALVTAANRTAVSLPFHPPPPPLFIRLTAKRAGPRTSETSCSACGLRPRPASPPAPHGNRARFAPPASPRPYPAREAVPEQRLLQQRGHPLQAQHVAEVGELLLSQGPGARRVKTVEQLLEPGLMLVLLCLIHPIARSAHLRGTEKGRSWALESCRPSACRPTPARPLGTLGLTWAPRSGPSGPCEGRRGREVTLHASHWSLWASRTQPRPGSSRTLSHQGRTREVGAWRGKGHQKEGVSWAERRLSLLRSLRQAATVSNSRLRVVRTQRRWKATPAIQSFQMKWLLVTTDCRARASMQYSKLQKNCQMLQSAKRFHLSPFSLAAPLCGQTGGRQQRGSGWTCLIQNHPCLHETQCSYMSSSKNANSINLTSAITWGVTRRVFPEACFSPREL